ncbi:MAG TPA: hypothetical protein DEQ43_16835 [Nocardioides bacterium]|uniref:hypothetical protein n=1 Tax=uncultured Nocardioides sp. TaxID=198441 RepID=UPI000ECB945E|nr:hypothetical protein [uncultured Nocardioides sp.]HCB05884.1 hypothetical protein [Nocardioides sp.]HRD61025.1 hypothetical protein [Nocardioides sp.]
MKTTKIAGLGLAAVLVIAGAGIAVANWSADGSGSGDADTDPSADLTITPGTPSAALYPGGTSAVVLTLQNPGVSAVTVGALNLATDEGVDGFEVDAGHPDCDEQSLSYTPQTNGGAGWTLPAGATLPVTLPGALALNTNADDGCQGATFTVHLVATP